MALARRSERLVSDSSLPIHPGTHNGHPQVIDVIVLVDDALVHLPWCHDFVRFDCLPDGYNLEDARLGLYLVVEEQSAVTSLDLLQDILLQSSFHTFDNGRRHSGGPDPRQ